MTLDELSRKYPGAQAYKFGDTPETNAHLIEQARSGRKTATCGALRDYDEDNGDMPSPGRRDIVLNWDGTPALVIETLSVAITNYCDMGPDFALAEGAGDMAEWRRDHKAYFERTGGFDEEMKLVCERFRVIEDLQ
ncbi:ASCH domain-containing protein [Roseibium sp. RKSG952]|uniref:ASCH domain-containing protein n=1 Tax=Roseibium sp. RKSG952 TaxID=2529384 RepID=UPI0012BD67CD|nr:ASCH domain-containing protein [Roseibium sp. RKSG952]MTH99282.1 ASCH domain-containing protein [Roseibium sp. RKSG952]